MAYARDGSRLIGAQMAVTLAALLLIALAPPAHGRMMLVPLGGQAQVARLALAHGSLLVGAGPLPGSLVIMGDRRALFGPLVRERVMLLAAPPAGCGGRGSRS